MGKTIALFNQKGGVGKTTTGINLCCALNEMGKQTLIVDTDPQGHSTSGMGVDKNNASPNVYDVLLNGVPADKAIVRTKYGDVLPSNKGLFGAGIQMVGIENREYILKSALEPIKAKYDFILIDCPALLELLTLNALCAAQSIIIPVQCEYLALEGLSDLMASVRMLRRSLNPDVQIEGIVLTMYDGRTNLSLQVASEVKKYMKEKVFRSVIPRNVRLSEAPSHGKPILVYDRSSRGAQAYIELAKELIKNNK
ncbi:MAG: ParA family protein [Clostridiales bacterium]|jgi:chromosome partitioning protein|nr:ParA family protein [Clostridiales bacterium]